MKKWIVFILLYCIIVWVGFQNKQVLLSWLNDSNSNSSSQFLLMFLISTFLSMFPIIPFTLFGGLMGIKYGVFFGFIMNWFGGVTAAVIYFFLSRYGFQETFRKKVNQYKGLEKFDRMISKNPFVAVLMARMITIVPPIVVNIYSGLSRMPFRIYLLATGVGKIPIMLFLAYSGNQFIHSKEMLFLGIGLYFLFIVSILYVYRRTYS